jgi:hypothetical protein
LPAGRYAIEALLVADGCEANYKFVVGVVFFVEHAVKRNKQIEQPGKDKSRYYGKIWPVNFVVNIVFQFLETINSGIIYDKTGIPFPVAIMRVCLQAAAGCFFRHFISERLLVLYGLF